MFTPIIRKTYLNLSPKQKDRVKRQIKDVLFIQEVWKKNSGAMDVDVTKHNHDCYNDFKERVYQSGITKLVSKNSVARFFNKFFHIKIGSDFVTYCAVPGKKGSINIGVTCMRPIKTNRGNLYVIRNENKKHFCLIHSHAIRRYGERYNGSTNLTECINMLLKEMAHAAVRVTTPNDDLEMLKKGYYSPSLNITIGSGMLLADAIWVDNDLRIDYIKTYVPQSMLSNNQDNIHEELWNEIMEFRDKEKVKMPLL